MITEQVDPAITDARVQIARAARKLVLRIFEVSPVTSHQSWDHILYLARLARDLERANGAPRARIRSPFGVVHDPTQVHQEGRRAG